MVYVSSRAIKRGYRPKEAELHVIMRAAGIPVPDVARRGRVLAFKSLVSSKQRKIQDPFNPKQMVVMSRRVKLWRLRLRMMLPDGMRGNARRVSTKRHLIPWLRLRAI